jgi:transposase
MGKAVGVSNASVQRIRSRNRIKPHRIKTFKVSNDPRFEEKFRDVIGLSLEPPEKAIVLCCDDKIQCQALERTQPGLPLGVGHIETKTHDDTRHGTIPLFAAPDSIEGRVLERTEQRHTQVEWLSKSPHFHLHFTPTSSSWLNLVERFFADITQECIRDGSFESVSRLEKAIHAYIEERNANPKPYRWVAEGKSILEKINRARTKLNKPVYETEH